MVAPAMYMNVPSGKRWAHCIIKRGSQPREQSWMVKAPRYQHGGAIQCDGASRSGSSGLWRGIWRCALSKALRLLLKIAEFSGQLVQPRDPVLADGLTLDRRVKSHQDHDEE
jgi:hypothetical protein